MAKLAPFPKFRAFNSSGAPLAGGKLYSYAAGTSTPQATYTGPDGLTPNANPTILDANGEADVWLDTSLQYKLALYDADDVLQWTVDSIDLGITDSNVTLGAITATSITATSGTFTNLAATNFSPTNLTTTALVAKTFNGFIFLADQYAGADAGAKIAAAIAAANAAGGGLVDARGLTGSQACTQNVFSGVTTGIRLLLGRVTLSTSAQWVVPTKCQVVGSGRGDASISLGTVIKAANSFPINTALVTLGDSSAIVFACRVEDLTIDCNNISGSIGLYSNAAQEQAGAWRVLVTKAGSYGIHMQHNGSQGPSHVTLEDIEVNCDSVTKGVYFENAVGRIVRATINRSPSSTSGIGVHIKQTVTVGPVYLEEIHCEKVTDGLFIEGTTVKVCVNSFDGNNGVTNLINIDSAVTGYLDFHGINGSGYTNAIKNDVLGHNLTTNVPRYEMSMSGSAATATFNVAAVPTIVRNGEPTHTIKNLTAAAKSSLALQDGDNDGWKFSHRGDSSDTLDLASISAGVVGSTLFTFGTDGSLVPGTSANKLGSSTKQWRVFHDVVATASLPAAGSSMNGTVLIEDAGAGDRNLIIYAGGQRFRIDGGASF